MLLHFHLTHSQSSPFGNVYVSNLLNEKTKIKTETETKKKLSAECDQSSSQFERHRDSVADDE